MEVGSSYLFPLLGVEMKWGRGVNPVYFGIRSVRFPSCCNPTTTTSRSKCHCGAG